MYLNSLSLTHFKNHSESYFSFGKGVHCFVGDNGAGKTNILDAIHYLSLCKSYFNRIDAKNIQFDEEFFIVKGKFSKLKEEYLVHCSVGQQSDKVVKCNEKRYERFSDHIGKFPVVIISPTDSNLIVDGAEERRRFLDSSIAQYNRQYLHYLLLYNKVLKQRNALLKHFSQTANYDSIALESLDKQLVNYGNIVYQQRKVFLDKMIPVFRKHYQQIANQSEQVDLIFHSQLNEMDFENALHHSLATDRSTQHTNVGIHKDDIHFLMNDHFIKKIGSQGQQKTFLMALKLAQYEFMEDQLGFKPILLLDDIFDKLDEKRVCQLIAFVNNGFFGQVFITDTHPERTKAILQASDIIHQIFNIDNGKVV